MRAVSLMPHLCACATQYPKAVLGIRGSLIRVTCAIGRMGVALFFVAGGEL